MAKYFVHEGLEFETRSVPAVSLNPSATAGTVDAVTLDSVATAFGTAIIPALTVPSPNNTSAKYLIDFWKTTGRRTPHSPSNITDQYQQLVIEILQQQYPIRENIVGVGVDLIGSPPRTWDFHQQSTQYILPIGFSNAWKILPGNNDDARDRIIVKSLEIDHVNIKKHDSITEARDAWEAYIITSNTDREQRLARAGYLNNP